MQWLQSNIKTVFVGLGFPEERRRFLKKCETESESTRGFEVEGHEGKFIETESIHDKYRLRPQSVEKLTLSQFAMRYNLVAGPESNKVKKNLEIWECPPNVTTENGWEGNLL